MRQVRCTTSDCEHRGVVRDVPDLPVVTGVVQRPPLYCAGCNAALADLAAPTPMRREKAVRQAPERRKAG